MHVAGWIAIAVVAVCAWTASQVLAPEPAVAAPAHNLEGRWELVIERAGWTPAQARATLVLVRKDKEWRGAATFQRLMNGRRLRVAAVEVKRSEISFALPALKYQLSGELEKGELRGVCVTAEGQRFQWTAKPREVQEVALFESGAKFDKDLPRGDATKLGIDVAELYDLVRAAEGSDTDALVVLKDGKTVCERTFGREVGPVPIMSVTKAVTGLALGALLEDEKIDSLDMPVADWFPTWADGAKADGESSGGEKSAGERAKVTLRHLATHTSGLAHGDTARALNAADDRPEHASALAVTAPGTTWSYNNEATAMLSTVIEKAAGKTLDEYVQTRLFDALGISRPRWNRDQAGHTVSYAELFLTARDLARVGRLVADDGKVGREQVLQPSTLEKLTGQATPLLPEQGVLWFRVLDDDGVGIGVRHDGWLGQHLVVLPDAGIVAVRLRHGRQGDGPDYNLGDFTGRVVALTGP